jgi:hypothetical protein
MPDRIDNALRAAAKALDEVVAPAVDPARPMAVEQVRFVADLLGILRARLPYAYDRDVFELRHYLRLGEALLGDAGPSDSALREAVAAAGDVERRAGARVPEIQACLEALTTSIGALVVAAGDGDALTRERIERAVLTASAALNAAQRSWFLPFGLDANPREVPPIERALQIGASRVPQEELQ